MIPHDGGDDGEDDDDTTLGIGFVAVVVVVFLCIILQPASLSPPLGRCHLLTLATEIMI